jgi:phage head maturation protease
MEVKIYSLKALDVATNTDPAKRCVKVAISQMGSTDLDNDIIDYSAFDATISAKGPAGTNEIWHLTDHGWRIADSALSKYQEMGKQGDYLYGVAPYRDTWLWREVAWPLYEAGDITQHSIGFRVVKQQLQDNAPRIIQEVELFEGSAVLWGANPNTPTLDLVKSHIENKKESFEDRLQWICKSLKSGKYKEDESLLVLELKQLENLYQHTHRKATPTHENDMEPEKMKALMDQIQLITHKHFA